MYNLFNMLSRKENTSLSPELDEEFKFCYIFVTANILPLCTFMEEFLYPHMVVCCPTLCAGDFDVQSSPASPSLTFKLRFRPPSFSFYRYLSILFPDPYVRPPKGLDGVVMKVDAVSIICFGRICLPRQTPQRG